MTIISLYLLIQNNCYLSSDFCPDNILLDEGGCLLVTYESRWSCIDRQISVKNIDGSCTNLHYRDWITTGGYLAPELLSPLTNPTSAADWWSIGALLYHLLTGQVSFKFNWYNNVCIINEKCKIITYRLSYSYYTHNSHYCKEMKKDRDHIRKYS